MQAVLNFIATRKAVYSCHNILTFGKDTQQRTVLYREEQSAADLQHGSCRTASTPRYLGCTKSAIISHHHPQKHYFLMLLESQDVFLGPFFLLYQNSQHRVIYKENRVFLLIVCLFVCFGSQFWKSFALASAWLLLKVCCTKLESREVTACVQQSSHIVKREEETWSTNRLLVVKVTSLILWDLELIYLWELFSHHQWAPPINTATLRM